MNKIYVKPNTEIVNVKLFGSVLDDGPDLPIKPSNYGGEILGKDNDFDWDDNDSFMGDLWADDEDEEY